MDRQHEIVRAGGLRSHPRRNRIGRAALLVAASLTLCPVSARAQGEARMPICAIDMGSNSFKRILGTFSNGRYEQTAFEKKTLGVGDDLSRNGRISDAKLAEIEQTLAAFQTTCAKQGATKIVAIGTAAFREAPNGARAIEVAGKLGIPMEIASEARESELAYLVGSMGRPGYAVIDNGSRSIELVAQESGREPLHSVFNLGYRIAYPKFFADARDPAPALDAFRASLDPEAAKAPFMAGHQALIGVEFDEMAEVLFPPTETEGRVITLDALDRRISEIASSGPEAFAALKQQNDIDRALPRLVVAATLARVFGYEAIQLTAWELGVGLIIESGLANS